MGLCGLSGHGQVRANITWLMRQNIRHFTKSIYEDTNYIFAFSSDAWPGYQHSICSGLETVKISVTQLMKRIVKRLDVIPGGQVRLYTGFFGSESTNKGRHIALRDLTLRRRLFTGKGHNGALSTNGSYTQLLCKDYLIGFLLDRRGSFMPNAKVLDELFYKEKL